MQIWFWSFPSASPRPAQKFSPGGGTASGFPRRCRYALLWKRSRKPLRSFEAGADSRGRTRRLSASSPGISGFRKLLPSRQKSGAFAYCRNLSGAPAASGKRPRFLDELSHLLSSPNNILGLEYCKALLTLHSSILPVTLKREGAGYHDPNLSPDRFASASAIRRALNRLSQTADQACTDPSAVQQLSDAAKRAGYVTSVRADSEAARSLFGNAVSQRSWITEQDFDTVLHYCLLSRSEDELVRYLDMSPAPWLAALQIIWADITDFPLFAISSRPGAYLHTHPAGAAPRAGD